MSSSIVQNIYSSRVVFWKDVLPPTGLHVAEYILSKIKQGDMLQDLSHEKSILSQRQLTEDYQSIQKELQKTEWTTIESLSNAVFTAISSRQYKVHIPNGAIIEEKLRFFPVSGPDVVTLYSKNQFEILMIRDFLLDSEESSLHPEKIETTLKKVQQIQNHLDWSIHFFNVHMRAFVLEKFHQKKRNYNLSEDKIPGRLHRKSLRILIENKTLYEMDTSPEKADQNREDLQELSEQNIFAYIQDFFYLK